MRTPFLHLLIAIAFVLLCGQRCTSIRLTADHIGVAHGGLLEWNEAQGDASVRGDDSTTSFRLGVSISPVFPFMGMAFIPDQLLPYGAGLFHQRVLLAGLFPIGKRGTLRFQVGVVVGPGPSLFDPYLQLSDLHVTSQVVYLWRSIDERSDAFFAGFCYLGPSTQSYELWPSGGNPVPDMSQKTFLDRLSVTGGYSAVIWRWLEFDISIQIPISSPLVFRSDYPVPHSWRDKYIEFVSEFRIIPMSF